MIAPPRVSRVEAKPEDREPEPVVPVSLVARSMGGRLLVHLDADGRGAEAARASRRLVSRIDRWAARLTRYTAESDLSILNGDPRPEVKAHKTAILRFPVILNQK